MADVLAALPARPRRAIVVVALVVAMITGVQLLRPGAGATLGAVTAVTPDRVIPDGFVGYVFHPTISGRGEAVTVHDAEVRENGFVLLDTPGQDPMVDGDSIAVSGDGCTAFWVRPSGSGSSVDATAIGVTDRCAGAERVVASTSGWYNDRHQVAVSHDGRFGVVLLQDLPAGTEFPSPRLVRVDTRTGATRDMPLPTGFFGWDPGNGIDISDDGSLVVVPIIGSPPRIPPIFPPITLPTIPPIGPPIVLPPIPPPPVIERHATTAGEPNAASARQSTVVQEVALWDVAAGTSTTISSTGALRSGGAAFPSISGDGRFVSWAAAKPYAGTETGTGPWVYVRDRANGATRLVSAPNGTAYDSSLSRDGSQVAYTVGPGRCVYDTQQFARLESDCDGVRIDVAFSSTPGFAGGFGVETISLDPTGRAVGQHLEPELSGNGRWVTWVSDAYGPLLGVSSDETGRRHAFVRRRDPGLSVDELDVGTILAGSSTVGTTTVRNTGRTSVVLDRIEPSPGAFAVVGGSCALGGSLPPGATCTVDVRFTAPGTTTAVNGSLLVGERGFDAVTATGPLVGAAVTRPTDTRPPDTTPPVVTSTTVTGQVVPTTTAGEVVLTASPDPLDFGGVAAGIGSPARTVTVTNAGTASGVLITTLTGAHPDDFFVARNGCNTVDLAPGASCTMDVILIARDAGERAAVLTTASGAASAAVDLRGVGTFDPRLVVTPAAVTERGSTTIVGQGFPPGDPVVVEVGTALDRAVTPDEAGEFRIRVTPVGLLRLGNHPVQVAARAGVYDVVRSQLVVVLPTFEPQGPGGPAFGSSIIVTRGS